MLVVLVEAGASGGVLKVTRTTVPSPWAVPTPITQVACPAVPHQPSPMMPGGEAETGTERAVGADPEGPGVGDVAVGGVGGGVHPAVDGGGALGDEPGPGAVPGGLRQAVAADDHRLAGLETLARA